MSEVVLSIEALNALCDVLINYTAAASSSSHNRSPPRSLYYHGAPTALINALANIIEYVVWGDLKDEAFFLLFCEKQIMKLFVSGLQPGTGIPIYRLHVALQTCIVLPDA